MQRSFRLGVFSCATRDNPDRRERRRLLDRELAGARGARARARKATPCSTPREPGHLLVEVEARAPAQQRAEALEELRDRREAERHVRERDLRRLLREHAERLRERLGILRRERRLEPCGASGAGPRRK